MRSPFALVSGALVCPAVVLAAQARPQSPPQFRGGIDVVEWDVSVYDKDHHNDHDQPVMDRTETLGPDRFDRTRSTGILTRLPTGDLAPGPYLLTEEATLGKTTARRELRFNVK